MNNTRVRSEQLNALAAEIAAREKIDPVNPPIDNRIYVAEIMRRGECHRETARQVWARYMRRARYEIVQSWGGAGRGQGRKSTPPPISAPGAESRE